MYIVLFSVTNDSMSNFHPLINVCYIVAEHREFIEFEVLKFLYVVHVVYKLSNLFKIGRPWREGVVSIRGQEDCQIDPKYPCAVPIETNWWPQVPQMYVLYLLLVIRKGSAYFPKLRNLGFPLRELL